MLTYRSGSELAVAEQVCLISADMVRSELLNRPAEIAGELINNPQVLLNRDWGVIAALELVQYHLT